MQESLMGYSGAAIGKFTDSDETYSVFVMLHRDPRGPSDDAVHQAYDAWWGYLRFVRRPDDTQRNPNSRLVVLQSGRRKSGYPAAGWPGPALRLSIVSWHADEFGLQALVRQFE